MRKIYERLYKSRDVEDCDINELISEIPELSEEQQASLEGEIMVIKCDLKNHSIQSKSTGRYLVCF